MQITAGCLPTLTMASSQVVGIVPRAPSPTDFADDSVDTIVLDDEMASIARRVKLDMTRQGSPVREGGGPETVKLKVFWKPHPLNPSGHADIWAMVQKRVCTLEEFCEERPSLLTLYSTRISIRCLPRLQTSRVYVSTTWSCLSMASGRSLHPPHIA